MIVTNVNIATENKFNAIIKHVCPIRRELCPIAVVQIKSYIKNEKYNSSDKILIITKEKSTDTYM